VIEVVVKDGKARCTCNGELLVDVLSFPRRVRLDWKRIGGRMEYRRIQIRELP